MRVIVLTVLASAWMVVVVSPRHRRAIARKVANARRFVSHRLVDTEARASSRAVDTWDGEGGASAAPDDGPASMRIEPAPR
jgi:hypothetical protein